MKEVVEYKEKLISSIDSSIDYTSRHDLYSIGFRNGMRYVKSLIDGKEANYEKDCVYQKNNMPIYD